MSNFEQNSNLMQELLKQAAQKKAHAERLQNWQEQEISSADIQKKQLANKAQRVADAEAKIQQTFKDRAEYWNEDYKTASADMHNKQMQRKQQEINDAEESIKRTREEVKNSKYKPPPSPEERINQRRQAADREAVNRYKPPGEKPSPKPRPATPPKAPPPSNRPTSASPSPGSGGGGKVPTATATKAPPVKTKFPLPPPPNTLPKTPPPASGSLPPAARLAGPLIGGAADFVIRVARGQPPAAAAFGSLGGVAGGILGGTIGGALGGPPGAFLGSFVGSMAGGFIADLLFPQPPSVDAPQIPTPTPSPASSFPVRGSAGILYLLKGDVLVTYYSYGQKQDFRQYFEKNIEGPIFGFRWEPIEGDINRPFDGKTIQYVSVLSGSPSKWQPVWAAVHPLRFSVASTANDLQIIDIVPIGPVLPAPSPSPSPNPAPSPSTDPSPNPAPSPSPSPNPAPSPSPSPNPAPAPSPSPSPNPGSQPNPSPSPSPAPAPSPSPSPNPGPQPNPSPSPAPAPSPSPSPNPGPQPNPSPSSTPGAGPGPNSGPAPNPNPSPSPNPSPGPTVSPSPNPAPSPSPSPSPNPNPPFPLPIPFMPPRRAEPPTPPPTTGGCSGCQKSILDVGNGNASKLDQLQALLQGLDLAGIAALNAKVDVINTKLGPQVDGGLSGLLQKIFDKLNKVAKWLHLDRVLNVLTWWQTLHNAYMLSNNLGQTLTSAISNVLAVIGIKDEDGSPLDIGTILGKQFDEAAKTALGESTWGGMKAEWKKYNRIYQAAANLLNSVQSIGQSILGALEVVGNWNASVANALRRFGVVAENAYKWFNPNVNFQNKFFTALEKTEELVSQVDAVASEVLSVQDTIKQIGEQQKELEESLKDTDTSKKAKEPAESEKIKKQEQDSKNASQATAVNEGDKEADD